MSSKSNLNNSSNKLISSSPIAIVISLAIHLLLLRYGFTKFAIEKDKKIAIPENVPTIELTPQEQSRLPQLTSELNIPELNPTPFSNNSSPFSLSPSSPENPNIFAGLPPISLPPPPSLTVPNVPPGQIPLSSLQSLPPILPPLPSLPTLPSTNFKLPPIGDTSALPLPPPVPSAPVESENKPASSTTAKPSTQTKPIAAKKPETKTSAETKPTPSPTQIAAQRQQKLTKEVGDLSSSLKKSTSETTNEEARKNYVNWLSAIKAVKPEELTIEGTYPRDACIRRLEGTSVYGALVDAQGAVTKLELIKGAKYPIFNQQASKNISARTLANDTGDIKPYKINVDFKYDSEICPSLTLPSLRKDNKLKPKESPSAPATTLEKKPLPPLPERLNIQNKPLPERLNTPEKN